MNVHGNINYIEIPAKNVEASKSFFTQVFGFEFSDFGPEYSAFSGVGIRGGFYKADLSASTKNGSVLVVFYSDKLEDTQAQIEAAGGTIVKATFSFPGGRRFHFCDPNKNEFAVWSDKEKQ
ncbi:MAG: VOC family protein [Magnetococcales bacterium]|nr:VOC family protein [Magnetococcales bacterium]